MLTTHLVLFSFLDGASVAAQQFATTYTFAGPSTGTVGQPTTDFTVQAVGTPSSDVTITPSDGGNGGSFNPATAILKGGVNNASAKFTYQQFKSGTYSLSVSSGGALTDPASISLKVAGAGLAGRKRRKQWYILPNGVRVLATSERYAQLVARATTEEKREGLDEPVAAAEETAPEAEIVAPPIVEAPKPIPSGPLLGVVPEPPPVAPASDAGLVAAEIEAERAMVLAAEHAAADAVAQARSIELAAIRAAQEAERAREMVRIAAEHAAAEARRQAAEDEEIIRLLLQLAA